MFVLWLLIQTVLYQQNNNNIIFIRLYATQAHGHKPYIQIHNTVINWKKPTYRYMSKQTEKNTTCTEILRKSWLYILIGLIIHNCISAFKTFYLCYSVEPDSRNLLARDKNSGGNSTRDQRDQGTPSHTH